MVPGKKQSSLTTIVEERKDKVGKEKKTVVISGSGWYNETKEQIRTDEVES